MMLWRVSQAQTFELLQDFANLLTHGKGKATALCEAQRKTLSKADVSVGEVDRIGF